MILELGDHGNGPQGIPRLVPKNIPAPPLSQSLLNPYSVWLGSAGLNSLKRTDAGNAVLPPKSLETRPQKKPANIADLRGNSFL